LVSQAARCRVGIEPVRPPHLGRTPRAVRHRVGASVHSHLGRSRQSAICHPLRRSMVIAFSLSLPRFSGLGSHAQ
jgi:hypothetical protein